MGEYRDKSLIALAKLVLYERSARAALEACQDERRKPLLRKTWLNRDDELMRVVYLILPVVKAADPPAEEGE